MVHGIPITGNPHVCTCNYSTSRWQLANDILMWCSIDQYTLQGYHYRLFHHNIIETFLIGIIIITDIYVAGIDVIGMLHIRQGLQNNTIVIIWRKKAHNIHTHDIGIEYIYTTASILIIGLFHILLLDIKIGLPTKIRELNQDTNNITPFPFYLTLVIFTLGMVH